MFCIQMGSDGSHLNVSLTVRGKVTRRCPQTTTLEEDGEPRQGNEPTSSAYQPNASPLGHTVSQGFYVRDTRHLILKAHWEEMVLRLIFVVVVVVMHMVMTICKAQTHPCCNSMLTTLGWKKSIIKKKVERDRVNKVTCAQWTNLIF